MAIQPKDAVMYASPTPDKVAPTYPNKPVIPHAAEMAFSILRKTLGDKVNGLLFLLFRVKTKGGF